jgi:hypothetical protein
MLLQHRPSWFHPFQRVNVCLCGQSDVPTCGLLYDPSGVPNAGQSDVPNDGLLCDPNDVQSDG